jgi:hypothetical protein
MPRILIIILIYYCHKTIDLVCGPQIHMIGNWYVIYCTSSFLAIPGSCLSLFRLLWQTRNSHPPTNLCQLSDWKNYQRVDSPSFVIHSVQINSFFFVLICYYVYPVHIISCAICLSFNVLLAYLLASITHIQGLFPVVDKVLECNTDVEITVLSGMSGLDVWHWTTLFYTKFHGAKSQKRVIFMIIGVRTLNLAQHKSICVITVNHL